MGDDELMAPKTATTATCQHNKGAAATLPFGDRQDFADAQRGFIASLDDVEIKNKHGRVVWSLKEYAFLAQEAVPDSVHPSLWRQARLNMNNGLYQVTDRIYQVRGFDLSNMTIIEGQQGIIVIDPLISTETAAAALALYHAHRGARPVTAVIYSHSHVDHYGGVKGVISEADVQAGRCAVIAPDRFLEEITQENVLVGGPMIRRGQFQFGAMLRKGITGQVDAGLGKVTSRGTVTMIPPTMSIREPVEVHVVDGVEIIFQLTPDSEAKAEMHMFYPALKALNLAENATHNLHNVYPIRGAQVRDANLWAKYLNQARHDYATKSDVVFAQHHWPVWGQQRVLDFLAKQRDAYKFLHDQTLRYMNHGYKSEEIAEVLEMPESLTQCWHTRGYYGTVRHNVKSIYQRYLGWYDANPVNLNPLPPVPRAEKMIAYMGGADAALTRAREDFAKGEYRWVAEVANAVVFTDPGNQTARALAADALEQMGYQAESATWRNAYLQGASELRTEFPNQQARTPVSADVVAALPVPLFFDYLAVRLNGPKAAAHRFSIGWHFRDLDERYLLQLENGALTYLSVQASDTEQADVTVGLERVDLTQLLMAALEFAEWKDKETIQISGDQALLETLFSLIDDFVFLFPILEPRRN